MSERIQPDRASRQLALGVGASFLLITALLVTQHLRHGWPFSLHHGVAQNESVYASVSMGTGQAAAARASLELDPKRLRAIGVRTERVREELLGEPLRAVATVVPDERRVSHVHTRVSGWVEELYVNTTGQRVRAGQPLLGIFSQELLASQNEYLIAKRGGAQNPASAILSASRSRLEVLGMSPDEIRTLDRDGVARRLVTIVAPRAGTVLHRNISVGTAVDPSTELVTVVDLAKVWVLAEIPEENAGAVAEKASATLEFSAAGRAPFEGSVAFVYPTLSERTRTLRVRFEADNRDGKLRPGIYGTAAFSQTPHQGLVVPRDAIVDTGESQHVFVVQHQRHFTPRRVTLGTRLRDRIEVVRGLSAGEEIVASGVFLIDSESRLRASGGAGTGHTGHEGH
jgi:multidrug efflux pump subunit AcrA (membrane-fusion protein)